MPASRNEHHPAGLSPLPVRRSGHHSLRVLASRRMHDPQSRGPEIRRLAIPGVCNLRGSILHRILIANLRPAPASQTGRSSENLLRAIRGDRSRRERNRLVGLSGPGFIPIYCQRGVQYLKVLRPGHDHLNPVFRGDLRCGFLHGLPLRSRFNDSRFFFHGFHFSNRPAATNASRRVAASPDPRIFFFP